MTWRLRCRLKNRLWFEYQIASAKHIQVARLHCCDWWLPARGHFETSSIGKPVAALVFNLAWIWMPLMIMVGVDGWVCILECSLLNLRIEKAQNGGGVLSGSKSSLRLTVGRHRHKLCDRRVKCVDTLQAAWKNKAIKKQRFNHAVNGLTNLRENPKYSFNSR